MNPNAIVNDMKSAKLLLDSVRDIKLPARCLWAFFENDAKTLISKIKK